MLRTLMQAYVKGSAEAVALYQKAFDAKLVSEYKHEDGSYYHSELDVYGQILAVSEANRIEPSADYRTIPGNTMQFCLHFKEDETGYVEKAYEVLKTDAQILFPLGPCDYCNYMVDLIDKFGVRWCLFA